MKVTKEDVLKALGSLETQLGSEETVSKASEQDLDQPEGADLGDQVHEKPDGKMSDAAKGKKKAEKSMKDMGEVIEEKKEEKKPMKKKAMDADEDESDTHGDHEGEPSGKVAKKMKKSFEEAAPEEIQTKIEVSGFLKSLVEHTGDVIDELRGEVVKSDNAHNARYEELAGAVEDVMKSQAKIGIVLKAICERIGVIEAAPARAPKAETVAKSAGTAERQFASGLAGEKVEKAYGKLSENPHVAKSQIATALCDLVKKGEAVAEDVIGFESGGFIRPDLEPKLKAILN